MTNCIAVFFLLLFFSIFLSLSLNLLLKWLKDFSPSFFECGLVCRRSSDTRKYEMRLRIVQFVVIVVV